METKIPHQIFFIVLLLSVLWILLHLPGVMYGTKDIPLHISYVGDEQAPINGALHMLEDKSILGIQNHTTAYYGPIFSIIAIPAILIDAGYKYITGEIDSALAYKNIILFDWGGILKYARIFSVLFSLLFIFSIYFLLKPKGNSSFSKYAFIGAILISLNYYFFEYSHFFKHWTYVIGALGVQWLSLKKICEDVHDKKWWLIHWLSISFSVGISYFSAMSTVMWLPVIISWVKERDFKKISMFVRLVYSTLISILILIYWHPTTVLRYIGMAGVEGVSNQGGQGVQSIFDFSQTSIIYYSKVLFLNQFPLLFVVLIFIFVFWKDKIYKSVEAWVILLPGVINFLFFIPPSHHEGRYMLPSIVSLIVLSGFFLVNYREKIKSNFTNLLICVLIASYLIFHIINIYAWIRVYAKGPIEQVMIKNILTDSQQEKTKNLIIQGYIAGYVHTKEAYKAYIDKFNKGNFNLYKELLSAPLPKNVKPLDAYYITEEDYFKDVRIGKRYDSVIYLYTPRKELEELNQFDYIDENIVRIWYYDDLMPSYKYIK